MELVQEEIDDSTTGRWAGGECRKGKWSLQAMASIFSMEDEQRS